MPEFRLAATSALNRLPSWTVDLVTRQPRLRRILRPLINRAVPSEMTEVTVRSGGAMGLRLLIDPQVEKYYWTGGHEPHVQKAIAANLHEGQTFWDIGSHIGYFALQAARYVGTNGRVVAFEPMPNNIARLSYTVKLNGFTNIDIIGEAVGAHAAEMPIYSRTGSSLMCTLDEELGDETCGTVVVDTLDRCLVGREPPDLVKIDAEGYESAVLRGAPNLIAQRCSRFLVEFMTEDLLDEAKHLLGGYEFKYLGDNHWLIQPS